MNYEKIEAFIKDENFNIDERFIRFIKSDYLQKISQTVFYEGTDWLINRIKRPFINSEILSDEFDSIDTCLKYFGSNRSNPALISKFFQTEEELTDNWKEFKRFHPQFRKGFQIIGLLDSPHASILLIGITESNYGQIWIEVGNSNSLIKMADDIDDLINKITFKPYSILTDQFGLKFKKSKEGYYEIETMTNHA
ncbi:MAG: hypothetical protein AB8G22_26050 [Saprospiraceae bacterium]